MVYLSLLGQAKGRRVRIRLRPSGLLLLWAVAAARFFSTSPFVIAARVGPSPAPGPPASPPNRPSILADKFDYLHELSRASGALLLGNRNLFPLHTQRSSRSLRTTAESHSPSPVPHSIDSLRGEAQTGGPSQWSELSRTLLVSYKFPRRIVHDDQHQDGEDEDEDGDTDTDGGYENEEDEENRADDDDDDDDWERMRDEERVFEGEGLGDSKERQYLPSPSDDAWVILRRLTRSASETDSDSNSNSNSNSAVFNRTQGSKSGNRQSATFRGLLAASAYLPAGMGASAQGEGAASPKSGPAKSLKLSTARASNAQPTSPAVLQGRPADQEGANLINRNIVLASVFLDLSRSDLFSGQQQNSNAQSQRETNAGSNIPFELSYLPALHMEVLKFSDDRRREHVRKLLEKHPLVLSVSEDAIVSGDSVTQSSRPSTQAYAEAHADAQADTEFGFEAESDPDTGIQAEAVSQVTGGASILGSPVRWLRAGLGRAGRSGVAAVARESLPITDREAVFSGAAADSKTDWGRKDGSGEVMEFMEGEVRGSPRSLPYFHDQTAPRYATPHSLPSHTQAPNTPTHTLLHPLTHTLTHPNSPGDKSGRSGSLLLEVDDDDETEMHSHRGLRSREDFEPYLEGQGVRPNDAYFREQWGLHDPDFGVNAAKAWESWTGEKGGETIVALIDSGVDLEHPDLKTQYWRNTREKNCFDGVDDDGNGYVDDCIGYDWIDSDNIPQDENGHGTASAGIIAAKSNNEKGISGLCWGCRLMVLRTLDKDIRGTISGFVRAIDYAIVHGAKVSNNSYGGRGSSFASLRTAVARAMDHGMVFVAAAGNYGSNNDLIKLQPTYPASYGESLSNVISVAAVDQEGRLAPFSCYGKRSVAIGAPGVGILSTTLNKKYSRMDGTSFATPFVTAAAALLYSREPHLTPQQIIGRIVKTARPVPILRSKIASGGLLDLQAALGTLVDPTPTPFPSSPPTPPAHPTHPPSQGTEGTRPTPGRSSNPRLPSHCALAPKVCPPHSDCVDTEIGIRCRCHKGYFHQAGECLPQNSCNPEILRACPNELEQCAPVATRNSSAQYQCVCKTGYRRVLPLPNGSDTRTHIHTPTQTQPTPAESHGTGPLGTCKDIDECSSDFYRSNDDRNVCPALATCRNTPGSFECVCPPGYRFRRASLSGPRALPSPGVPWGVGSCERLDSLVKPETTSPLKELPFEVVGAPDTRSQPSMGDSETEREKDRDRNYSSRDRDREREREREKERERDRDKERAREVVRGGVEDEKNSAGVSQKSLGESMNGGEVPGRAALTSFTAEESTHNGTRVRPDSLLAVDLSSSEGVARFEFFFGPGNERPSFLQSIHFCDQLESQVAASDPQRTHRLAELCNNHTFRNYTL